MLKTIVILAAKELMIIKILITKTIIVTKITILEITRTIKSITLVTIIIN